MTPHAPKCRPLVMLCRRLNRGRQPSDVELGAQAQRNCGRCNVTAVGRGRGSATQVLTDRSDAGAMLHLPWT
jgi:hypothetical protein